MTIEKMREVADRHVTAENARDLEGAISTYHDDCFYDVAALGLTLRGKDAVAANYAGLFAAMPDGKATFNGHAYGTNVVVHWGVFEGTVTGDFMGMPPTGRRVSLPFAGVLEFKEGLMHGERLFYDLATLCEQAGLPLDRVRQAAQSLSAAFAGSTAATESVQAAAR